MATRTVRLDADDERVLKEIQAATGLPLSEAIKQGLHALRARLTPSQTVYDIYRGIRLGPGGSSLAPSTDVRRAVRAATAKKLRR